MGISWDICLGEFVQMQLSLFASLFEHWAHAKCNLWLAPLACVCKMIFFLKGELPSKQQWSFKSIGKRLVEWGVLEFLICTLQIFWNRTQNFPKCKQTANVKFHLVSPIHHQYKNFSEILKLNFLRDLPPPPLLVGFGNIMADQTPGIPALLLDLTYCSRETSRITNLLLVF